MYFNSRQVLPLFSAWKEPWGGINIYMLIGMKQLEVLAWRASTCELHFAWAGIWPSELAQRKKEAEGTDGIFENSHSGLASLWETLVFWVICNWQGRTQSWAKATDNFGIRDISVLLEFLSLAFQLIKRGSNTQNALPPLFLWETSTARNSN